MEPDARKFRKHLRVKQFDYTSNCAYFVTLCTENRRQAFGEINDGKLEPTRRGMIVQECWNDIPNHHPFVQLDAFILMPNHIHGVLVFVGDELNEQGTGRDRLQGLIDSLTRDAEGDAGVATTG